VVQQDPMLQVYYLMVLVLMDQEQQLTNGMELTGLQVVLYQLLVLEEILLQVEQELKQQLSQ
jgi:hypothetical protein